MAVLDEFNDRTLTLRAGPRFLFERFDLRPELTARARHLSGKIYSRAAGIRLSGDWHVAEMTAQGEGGRGLAEWGVAIVFLIIVTP